MKRRNGMAELTGLDMAIMRLCCLPRQEALALIEGHAWRDPKVGRAMRLLAEHGSLVDGPPLPIAKPAPPAQVIELPLAAQMWLGSSLVSVATA